MERARRRSALRHVEVDDPEAQRDDFHVRETACLQHLSEVAGVGITQLKSVFHDMTGGPVHRYVVERRVERAAQLLARGVAISDAAAQAGFSHASHMARWMRRLMHVTPSQLSKR